MIRQWGRHVSPVTYGRGALLQSIKRSASLVITGLPTSLVPCDQLRLAYDEKNIFKNWIPIWSI
jgi:hypothetical protein